MKQPKQTLIERKEEIKKKVISGIKRSILVFNLVDEGYKEDEVIRILGIIDAEIKEKNKMGVTEIAIACFLFMIGFLTHLVYPITWWEGVLIEGSLFMFLYWITRSPAFESKIPNNYWVSFYVGRFIAGLGTAVYIWRFGA